MKGFCIAAAFGTVLASATSGWAQTSTSPVSRADIAGTIGWFNARQSIPDISSYGNDWYSRSVYGGVSTGWYWNDHWKTEVDAGASTQADLRGTQSTFVDGRVNTVYSTYEFRTARLAVGQHYQFFRNVWIHPFIAGGVDFTWETIERYDEVISPFPAVGLHRADRPDRREFHTRPFVTFGLKAYMTPHGFFRSDMKFVTDRDGLDEVILRAGFGIDF
jgi:hypothetical protein